MYPGPRDPDLGAFVAQAVGALRERGHDVCLAVLDSRAGGNRRWLTLARRAVAAARAFRPDVVHAHFLFPTGLIGALAGRAPLVVTAHGQDVANIGSIRGVAAATAATVKRAAAVTAVSYYLRRELEARLRLTSGTVEVVDSGVDLERFAPADAAAARTELGWEGAGPRFVCVGSLSERKNVVRLARAFARLDAGQLVFVGDGPLRPQLEDRERVTLARAVPHDRIPRWLAAADVVCQPSLVEPFGQALLEAMACARSVVATRVGGPPEFVADSAGVLVDPLDEAALASALERAADLPAPNAAARQAAATHDVRRQAARLEAILERAARGR
jgi:glycosyltransferase involved in cell wall biosynthesis